MNKCSSVHVEDDRTCAVTVRQIGCASRGGTTNLDSSPIRLSRSAATPVGTIDLAHEPWTRSERLYAVGRNWAAKGEVKFADYGIGVWPAMRHGDRSCQPFNASLAQAVVLSV
jgi:hypothetical protein